MYTMNFKNSTCICIDFLLTSDFNFMCKKLVLEIVCHRFYWDLVNISYDFWYTSYMKHGHETSTMIFFFLKLSVLIVGSSVCFGLVAMIWITKGPLCGVATTQPRISTTGLQWSPIVTLTMMIVLWSYTHGEHGPILAVLPKFRFSAKKLNSAYNWSYTTC